MAKMIVVKDGSTEFLTNPKVIYNLNLGHLLVKFKSIETTPRNTAFAVYVPAAKELVLVAGQKDLPSKALTNFNTL